MTDAAMAPSEAGADPWDDWELPPRRPGPPVLHLDGFDGPLDLLLDLAERQRIDLGRISILALAEQFVAAVERVARQVPVERRADWLVLASRLLLLRSKLLFPGTPAEHAAAQREAAREVEWLEDRRFLHAAAAWLQVRPQLGQEVFARPRGRDPRTASYMALMEACLTVLQGREGQPGTQQDAYVPVRHALFSVAEAIARVRRVLADQTQPAGLATFVPRVAADMPDRHPRLRSAICSTFAACLELTRTGEATIAQEHAFGEMVISPCR